MKTLLYLGILAAVWLVPVKGTDVGKLIPVEVIAVGENEGIYTVRTDTGDLGMGENLRAVFDNLEQSAPGKIYLDTAQYLLLEPDMDPMHFRKYLKDSVKVCKAEEGIALDGIADFLSAHKPGIKLNRIADIRELPMITEENGRYLATGK